MAEDKCDTGPESMKFEDKEVTRIFHDLKAAQVLDQRLSLLDLLQRTSAASAADKLEIPHHFRDLWEDVGTMEEIHNLQWRMGIIQAACYQIHDLPADERAISSYLDLATEACQWGASNDGRWGGEWSSSNAQAVEHAQKNIVLFCTRVVTVAAQCASPVDSSANIEVFLTTSLNFVRLMSVSKEFSDSPEKTFAHICADFIDSVGTLLLKIRESLDSMLVTRTVITSSENRHISSKAKKHQDILTLACDNLVHVANVSAGSGYLQVLNASWKALICLLQPKQGCEFPWGENVDICKVIGVLVGQAVQKLKVALDLSIISPDNIASPAADCKGVRPIKFFVTYAVRIARWYPKQAGGAHALIAQFSTKLFATLSVQPDCLHHTDLKKALCETVWPVTCMLLHTVLNSENVGMEQKSQLLLGIVNGYASDCTGENNISITEQVFPTSDTRMSGVYGKVGCTALYLHLLLVSSGYRADVLVEFCKHLDWLLDSVAEEEVYSSMVELQTFPKHTKEGTYTSGTQTMFVWALQALGIFATVAASSGILYEVELFLFRNAIHPCGLCAELIKDVWCFLVRHGEQSLVSEHISAAFSILQAMCSSRLGRDSEIPLQRMARLLCSLLVAAPEREACRIFQLTYNQESFKSPSMAILAHLLLQEGFSFALLPEHHRMAAMLQLTDTCLSVLSDLSEQIDKQDASGPSEAHERATACLLDVLRLYTETGEQLDSAKKKEAAQVCLRIAKLSLRKGESGCDAQTIVVTRILRIFLYVREALDDDDMKDLLTLLERNICCGASQDSRRKLTLTPALAEFLAVLSDINFEEDGQDPSTQALWNLYHVVLKEEHWALFHAGLTSFAKFASSTCLGELWRFIPPIDTPSTQDGSQPTSAEEVLMSALQVFLERQQGRPYLDTDTDERDALRMECKRQKTASFTPRCFSNGTACKIQPHHGATLKHGCAVALSSDLSKALAMLQEGVQLLQDRLPVWLLNNSARDSEQYQWLASQLAQVRCKVGQLTELT